MKFKQGDRVAGDWAESGRSGYTRIRGRVTDIQPNGVHIAPGDVHSSLSYVCAPNSIRKLKPRAKPREWWLVRAPSGLLFAKGSRDEAEKYMHGDEPAHEMIHVREVKK